MTGIEHLVQRIRDHVEQHEPDGRHQWYVDEHTIDCDADQFWAVTTEAIREEWPQP